MTPNTFARPALGAALALTLGALGACASSMDAGAGMNAGMDGGMSASADGTVMVGGAAMYPSRNIVENAVNSRDHTTLVAAVKAAGLVDTLSSAGPFTVFAPTNAAFAKLPAGTVDSLVQPANKPTLTKILTYHVVPGKLSASALNNGRVLTTVQGERLTVVKRGNMVHLRDAKGGEAMVTIADVNQSNGVIHVIDTVLMPR
jgi:uncharacterized surface protein with fasciclin (FAS1) repeats